jgi:hypothetical protein
MTTGTQVIKNFMKRGFKLLGDGCYAAVFESNTDPNIVYKVGNNAQDPYLEYINAHIDSEYFPKVHKAYIDYDNSYYVVIMERLEPLPDHKRKAVEHTFSEQFEGNQQVPPDMQVIVDHINKLLEGCNDLKLDLHAGNIMLRGLTPVITDPVCHDEIDDYYDLSIWMDKHGESLQKVVRA